ncbi:Crp/Fnr family transcriptional regulator [Clostridium polyendosporum]|uniref:Crp/Fnr family transcriptional regulator n=1 Tax=Clostridium polyendosporum TaxID=69208 RepID=A0A919RVU8_9CLOT|nr:Crp/Fnr family transcriptional regulator [Clostridium polyendosporum]GIM27425.1 Crp/Fnr family transcriptional regulator [Clostridium polyendosporum]
MKTCNCISCKTKLCASKVPIFSALSKEDIVKIVSKIHHYEYKKGEPICLEGELSDSLIIINNGKVKLTKITKEGKEQIIRLLTTGDFLGEFSIFSDNETYNFSAYALSPVNICSLNKEDMNLILMENPEISIKILKEVSQRLMQTENLAQNLATNDAEIRVANLILELSEKYGKVNGNRIEIKLPISREDMANYIGVTRETISRKLNKFQELGIITLIGNKTLIILDKEALMDYI